MVRVSDHYFSRRPSSPEKRGLIRCRLRGMEFEFVTSSGVFSHRRIDPGTSLLIDSMELPGTGRILDVGCGYGPIGIVAARMNPGLEVWMTELNERAVGLAEENLIRNGVENAQVRRGYLYEPVEGLSFEAIVSNPPISAGMGRVVKPLVEGAFPRLINGGSLQLVVQWNKGGRTLAGLMEEKFGNVGVLGRKGGYRALSSEKKEPSTD